MKIALANNYYYLRGGSERVLFDDQKALEALGHEVRPFAQYDEKNHAASSATFFLESQTIRPWGQQAGQRPPLILSIRVQLERPSRHFWMIFIPMWFIATTSMDI